MSFALSGFAGRRARLTRNLGPWTKANGHLVLALVGAGLFVLIRPPVADLQAADARAAASARGVGLSYWLSWYSGSAPGDYSILTPKVTATLGVATSAALSVLVIALLVRPLLAGSVRARSAVYIAVACALCNLWSGRVPFGLAAAVSLAGLLALRRGRPWLGGALNGLAAIFSPLAPAFVLLGLLGPAVADRSRRADLVRFGALSLAGLAVPTVAFGVPGSMPFALTTMAWTVGILLAMLLVPLPRALRLTLAIAVVVCLALFFVPNGVGANISRFAYLAVPPVVWAMSRARTRLLALVLVPALAYGAYNVSSDLLAAAHPSAQEGFYTALRQELVHQPDLRDYRVEVVDTQTHRAAAELVPSVYLARGWEDQSDTEANPIFYSKAALTASSYQAWLGESAVAWVAVPTHPGDQGAAEAALVNSGPSYLHEVWHDANWRLFSVQDPQPIVSAPARMIRADETAMTVDVPTAGTVTFKIRTSRYLQLTLVGGVDSVCLTKVDPTTVQATISTPGQYTLDAHFSVPKMLGGQNC